MVVVNCAGHFDLILGIRGVAKPASDATAEWEGARAGGEQGATEQLVAFHMHTLCCCTLYRPQYYTPCCHYCCLLIPSIILARPLLLPKAMARSALT